MVSLQSARVSSLLTNKLPRLCVSRTLANFPRDRRIHKSLDDYKWPSFKNWTPYMVEKLGIKFHEYNKFEDAFPVVSINDNKDEETLLPPLVCEFVRDNINESFIASGDYKTCSHELIPLLSSLRANLQQAEGERAKVLAMFIINLMELISEETYFSQSPIALALGSSIVQGDIDLSICKHRGFTRLELFKTPRAVGHIAQEWPQIAGHLLASCMENIGDTVKPQEAFLVNINNRYMSFFHLLIPEEYINHIKRGEVPNTAVNISSYPEKECPLDLMQPASRKKAFLALHRIARYIRSPQSRIGNY